MTRSSIVLAPRGNRALSSDRRRSPFPPARTTPIVGGKACTRPILCQTRPSGRVIAPLSGIRLSRRFGNRGMGEAGHAPGASITHGDRQTCRLVAHDGARVVEIFA